MGTGTQAASAPSPALVVETLTAYQRPAALCAAIELEAMCQDAGLGEIGAHPLPVGPPTVVTGQAW